MELLLFAILTFLVLTPGALVEHGLAFRLIRVYSFATDVPMVADENLSGNQ
jgi:hypothetical protein